MKKSKFMLVEIEPEMKEMNNIADKNEIVQWIKTGSKTIVGRELILVEIRV